MKSGFLKLNYRDDREIFPFFIDKLVLGFFIVILISCPFYISGYWLHLLNLMGIIVIGSIGLNLLMGYTGQISLGHAAFIAVGAYSAAIFQQYFPSVSTIFVFIFAALISGISGMLAAIPAFRLKGLYLALSTLAIFHIFMFVIVKGGSVTHGATGMVVSPPNFIWFSVDSPLKFYWLIWSFVAIGIICSVNLMRTKAGRAFIAIRDNDNAAEASGVSLNKWKTISFVISSIYAGVCGVLYAYYIGFITPEDFTLRLSITYIVSVIIGGMGSLPGPLLGSFFVVTIPEIASLMSKYLFFVMPGVKMGMAGEMRSYLEMVLFGLIVVLFVVFEPDGLFGRWKTIKNYFVLWPFRY